MKQGIWVIVLTLILSACSADIESATERIKAELEARQTGNLLTVPTDPPYVIPVKKQSESNTSQTISNELSSSNKAFSRVSEADLWNACHQIVTRMPASGNRDYQKMIDVELIEPTKSPIEVKELIQKGELKAIYYTFDAEWKLTYDDGSFAQRFNRNIECRYSERFNYSNTVPYKFDGGITIRIYNQNSEEIVSTPPNNIPEPSLNNNYKQQLYDVCIDANNINREKVTFNKDEFKIELVRWRTPIAKIVHGVDGGYFYKVKLNYIDNRNYEQVRECEVIDPPDREMMLRRDY